MRTVPPTKVDGYLAVARELLQGVDALAPMSDISPRAAAMLAAQALECVLHAFLLHKGVEADRNPEVWHNSLALWGLACEKGLDIPKAAPDWVTILSSGHERPFYLRYQRGEKGTIVNGGQTPALIPMTEALKKLVKMVEIAVKG